MGHCPNSSYIPWFWSNYTRSLKRHHITRSTKIIEAERSNDCTRNQQENSVNFIMIQCKSKIHLPLQHWNVLYSSHLGKGMQESEEVQQQREEIWKVSNVFVKPTWAKQQPCAVEESLLVPLHYSTYQGCNSGCMLFSPGNLSICSQPATTTWPSCTSLGRATPWGASKADSSPTTAKLDTLHTESTLLSLMVGISTASQMNSLAGLLFLAAST